MDIDQLEVTWANERMCSELMDRLVDLSNARDAAAMLQPSLIAELPELAAF